MCFVRGKCLTARLTISENDEHVWGGLENASKRAWTFDNCDYKHALRSNWKKVTHARTHAHTHLSVEVFFQFKYVKQCVTSGFRREVAENCALRGCYAANSGHFLPTFRENRSAPSSGFVLGSWDIRMGAMGRPETSVRNYHYSPRNDPEERSTQYSKQFGNAV